MALRWHRRMKLSRQQITLLITLTLVWGLNWPVLKLGVSHYPPLSFRSLSMWMGLPFLALVLYVKKVPFKIPAANWKELFVLATTNLLIWHVLIILAVQQLSSGRSAILGYTMPIFSALIGVLWFGAALKWRGWLGVGSAALGVVLLLWHEFSAIAGKPLGVLLGLVAAAFWGLGTQQIRHTRIRVPTLAIAGAQDGASTPDQVRATADLIPGAIFHTIPGAGHLPPVETPAAWAALVAPFLKEHAHG